MNTIIFRLKINGKAIVILPKRFSFQKELDAFNHQISLVESSLRLLFKCTIRANEEEEKYMLIFDAGHEEEFEFFIFERIK